MTRNDNVLKNKFKESFELDEKILQFYVSQICLYI